MRAERLINILTTLQARGRVTATELAEENNVSLRTIYRDIDNLALAGIPVYAERGSQGGYRLVNGYKVRLNGMNEMEVRALFLSGLGETATGLGLDLAIDSAKKKVTAALPETMRQDVEQLRKRFYLDAPAWFSDTEHPEFLQAAFDAVWGNQKLKIHYRSWTREKTVTLAPLGIVLKGGSWYLVGQEKETPRTYKITRILSLQVLDDSFSSSTDFDLTRYWQESSERLDQEMHTSIAHVRVSPLGLKILPELSSSYARRNLVIVGQPDTDGWQEVSLPISSNTYVANDFLRLGSELEVLSPASLRDAMRDTVSNIARYYEKENDS